jgi:hypothetical protein
MRLITRHENLESDGTEANLVLNNYTNPANTPSVYKPKQKIKMYRLPESTNDAGR